MLQNDIDEYLLNLRNEGYGYYNINEILQDYKSMINGFVENGYNFMICELLHDMEIWYLLEKIKAIIETNIHEIKKEHTTFINEFKATDDLFTTNSLQIHLKELDLPWWYYRVLKKGNKLYVDDVKLEYGIDIELVN